MKIRINITICFLAFIISIFTSCDDSKNWKAVYLPRSGVTIEIKSSFMLLEFDDLYQDYSKIEDEKQRTDQLAFLESFRYLSDTLDILVINQRNEELILFAAPSAFQAITQQALSATVRRNELVLKHRFRNETKEWNRMNSEIIQGSQSNIAKFTYRVSDGRNRIYFHDYIFTDRRHNQTASIFYRSRNNTGLDRNMVHATVYRQP